GARGAVLAHRRPRASLTFLLSSHGAIVPAALTPRLLALAGGEQGEQLLAVAVQLAGADALDRQQLAAAAGPPLGQGGQGAVVEHHVRGYAVGLGPLAPPRPQLL